MWWTSRLRALATGKKFDCITVAGKSFLMNEARAAMGINWMTRDEISQAIPPAYTNFIGSQMLAYLRDGENQPVGSSGERILCSDVCPGHKTDSRLHMGGLAGNES